MQNKKQHIITMLIIIVAVAGGAFYGGTIYEKSSLTSQGLLRNSGSQFGNRMGQGGQEQSGQRPGRPGGMMGQPGAGGGIDFTTGQITAKDDKSITLKTQGGGSKIIFFSGSTIIGKADPGSAEDLTVGGQVLVNGKANADGSLSAQNIQIKSLPIQ